MVNLSTSLGLTSLPSTTMRSVPRATLAMLTLKTSLPLTVSARLSDHESPVAARSKAVPRSTAFSPAVPCHASRSTTLAMGIVNLRPTPLCLKMGSPWTMSPSGQAVQTAHVCSHRPSSRPAQVPFFRWSAQLVGLCGSEVGSTSSQLTERRGLHGGARRADAARGLADAICHAEALGAPALGQLLRTRRLLPVGRGRHVDAAV